MKKKSKIKLLTIAMLVTLVALPITANAASPKKQSITASNRSVVVGTKYTSLKAKSKTSRTYKSSNSSVVSVNRNGYVTAKRVGYARITINAKSTKYYRSAKKVITVTVIPQSNKLTSVSAVSPSQIKVKYSRKSGITGYQVRYSTSSKMKSPVYKYFSGTSPVISGLKSNKRYYIQTRTYKALGSKKYYSQWSKSSYASTQKVVHKHSWQEVTKTITHKEVGHWVKVLDQPAWTEEVPVYEYMPRQICNVCKADITGNTDQHAIDHALNDGIPGGFTTTGIDVLVGTEKVEHEATYNSTYVVDTKAWYKTVTTGYKCTCGDTKPA